LRRWRAGRSRGRPGSEPDVQGLRYLEDAVTLEFDAEKCNGCRACTIVCPHRVFDMRDKRAVMVDRGACMECGACALNCAPGAISVTPGVGCAEAIIHSWIYGGEPTCGCDAGTVVAPGATTSGSCCGGVSAMPSANSSVGEPSAQSSCCGEASESGSRCC
jgi:ferredoxin